MLLGNHQPKQRQHRKSPFIQIAAVHSPTNKIMISIEQGGLRWVLVGSYIKSIATMGWGPSLTIQSFLAAINYWRSPSGRMCKVMGSKITLPLCPEFQWVGDEFMTSSFTTPSDKVSRGSQANRIYLHASGGLTSKWRRERILTWLQGVSKKSC